MRSSLHSGQKARFRTGVLASAVITALGGISGGQALAQEDLAEEVIITGSRIVRRDFQANSPIMTIDEELFDNTSATGVENIMNQLPQFVPAVTQFTTTDVQGTATNTPGASTLSLRGLGANRNLVLLNGRRAMPINASGATDMNMIPSAAIQRVETITGGASSVYGADAMAGVVNFILKDNYEGFELDAQYGLTEEGDNETERLSGLWGATLDGDRGNVLLGFEYSRRGPVLRADRQFFQDGWADITTGGTATRMPNTQYQPGTTTGGLPSQAAVDALLNQSPVAVSRTGSFFFNDDGTIFKNTPDGSYRYNGPTQDQYGTAVKIMDDGQLAKNLTDAMISIPMERYAMFGSANYDITDDVTAFFQATFAQNTNRTLLQYSPVSGNWGIDIPHGTGIYPDSLNADGTTNPAYLPGGLYGLNCGPLGGCTNTEVFPVPSELETLLASRPDPNASFRMGQDIVSAGPRRTTNRVTSFQFTTGLEGNVGISDWTWETFVSYGTTTSHTALEGFAAVERVRALFTSPNYGRGFFYTGNPQGGGFGSGQGRCSTGMPVFTQFTPDPECITSITATMHNQSDMEQKIGEANIQGHVMDLPAGELRFAAGAAYRENSFVYLTDTLTSQGSFLDYPAGVFPGSNSQGQTKTRDIYGELLIPVLKDLPLIQSLQLETGYRKSWNDPSPDVDTYKVLVDWAVTDRIRLRGGRQIANRAPNIGELFLSRTQTLVGNVDGDYCSTRNPGNTYSANPALNPNAANVRAICEALMGPTGAEQYYSDPLNQSNSLTGQTFINLVGNPDLKNERAETITVGGVFNIIDGLSLSADWYEIEITDMISSETASAVYLQCMSPDTNPGFDPNHSACQRLVRNPQSGQMEPTDVQYSNLARAKTSGVDLQANYRGEVWNGSYSVGVQASWLDSFETQVTPTGPITEWAGTFGPNNVTGVQGGSYDYRTFTTLSYFDNAGWNLTLRWRYLPEISNAGAAAGTTNISDTADQHMFDLSGGMRLGEDGQYFVRYGIDNLLNEKPEITGRNLNPADPSTGVGQTNSQFYDVLGRRFYVGLNVQF
jgi:iron complex outermembrane receptor protein